MNVIWNLTRVCPYNCKICSVCSIPINGSNKDLLKAELQRKGEELSYAEKLATLNDLANAFEFLSIDFSGGDPLIFKEDLDIIYKAFDLGISAEITATGHTLNRKILRSFKGKAKMMEFTLDIVPHKVESTREQTYHLMNLQGIKLCVEEGIPVRVCTVLKKDNSDKSDLKKLYDVLADMKVAEWELLRFYPIGRGAFHKNLIPSKEEYKSTIEYGLGLEREKGPRVGIQHSFHTILKELGRKPGQCQAVVSQLGILPDGTVLACPWALNEKGEPLDEIFVLGKTPKQKIENMLKSKKARKWTERALNNSPSRTMAFLNHSLNGETASKAVDLEDSYDLHN